MTEQPLVVPGLHEHLVTNGMRAALDDESVLRAELDSHRPERAETLEQLGLGTEAEPLEVLAVSGGGRTGDTYELTPLPQPGPVSLPFLVHGIRHLTSEERAAIDDLKPGDRLELRLETDNEVNERALLVRKRGVRLGYVPDPLLDYIHRIRERPFALVVDRVNPVEAGMHVRLLVRVTGELVVWFPSAAR